MPDFEDNPQQASPEWAWQNEQERQKQQRDQALEAFRQISRSIVDRIPRVANVVGCGGGPKRCPYDYSGACFCHMYAMVEWAEVDSITEEELKARFVRWRMKR